MNIFDYTRVSVFANKLNDNKKQMIKKTMALYNELDRGIYLFKKHTGLRCPSLCGFCCNSTKVETTVLEMLPIAAMLWSQKKAESSLKAIDEKPYLSACIFYKSESNRTLNGRCSVYSIRPMICRLFGFSAITNKHGKNRLVTCSIIRKSNPQQCENAQRLVSLGLQAPKMTDFSFKAFNINPDLMQRQVPINQAAKEAIERVGFYMHFKSQPQNKMKTLKPTLSALC